MTVVPFTLIVGLSRSAMFLADGTLYTLQAKVVADAFEHAQFEDSTPCSAEAADVPSSCLEPPPGLGPPGLVPPAEPTPAPAETNDEGTFQVLVRGLPDLLVNNPEFIWAMFEQAHLDDGVVGYDTRPGGKLLVKLQSLDWVRYCINHFQGREWAGEDNVVSALYVRTIKRQDIVAYRNFSEVVEQRPKDLSPEAAEFVPSAPIISSKLSVEAPVFKPSSDLWDRERFHSDASTAASVSCPADNTSSEGDVEVDRIQEEMPIVAVAA